MKIELKKEYHTYLRNLDRWTTGHLDEFVLIKDHEVIGFYKSYEIALEMGLKKLGNVPFFIKIIKKEEEVHFFHQGVG